MMTVDEGSELAECLDDMLVTYETAGVGDLLDAVRVTRRTREAVGCGYYSGGGACWYPGCDSTARQVGAWLRNRFAERRREQAARRAVDAVIAGPKGRRDG